MAKASLFNRFNELILTFGYSGKSRFAPGTVGSIFATLCWYFTNNYFIEQLYSLILISLFWIFLTIFLIVFALYGIKPYQIFYQKNNIDDKSIVVDEAVGIFITLEIFRLTLGKNLYIIDPLNYIIYILVGLALFRFFDIKKPWIIGICDRNFKNAWGVLLDDILCGFGAGLLTILFYIYTRDNQWFNTIRCY